LSEQRAARILIAEDESNLRLVLQKELERLGYRVQSAPDGEAALRKLEESNVDVLLCDINMPRIDGMEVLRRVHERPNPPEVIMLTGQATVETAVEAKLRAEMMKLQAQYTKQLQQSQSKNAPVQVASVTPPQTSAAAAEPQVVRSNDDRPAEPSAAQLDLQRQRETTKVAEPPAVQVQSTVTQAPEPVQQQQPAVVAAPQIREGDVVDVGSLDVVPKRTRDPRVTYPPMAARDTSIRTLSAICSCTLSPLMRVICP